MEGEIKNIIGEKDAAFILEINGEKKAEMVYRTTGPAKLIILHTWVDESLKGKSIGKKLQTELVEYARANRIKVVPLCPFANAMFKKISAWQDVLA